MEQQNNTYKTLAKVDNFLTDNNLTSNQQQYKPLNQSHIQPNKGIFDTYLSCESPNSPIQETGPNQAQS